MALVLGTGYTFDILCQLQLQQPIGVRLTEQLRRCNTFIVNSVLFDFSRTTVLSNVELSRINEMKRSNPKADVLLTIALPLNVSITATHAPLSERIGFVLRDNGLDGVDLDFDITSLDDYGRIRYGQFLRALRSLLGNKYLVSTTIGCQSLGDSRLLLESFNDQLDMVSVIGVDTPPASVGESEFTVRDYTIEPIRQLVQQGLNVQKIVLSVLTVGIVFNPSNYRNSRSLQARNRVGVLSYSQVCELIADKRAKCGTETLDSGCSLFSGKGAIVYDDEQTVERRTTQAKQFGARGVLMLLNYDDADNVCDRGSYPLFKALCRTIATDDRVFREGAGGAVCSHDGRYADTQDPSVYYTYQDGRFHQHRCADGELFNNVLEMCIQQMQPIVGFAEPPNPVDVEDSASNESPFASESTTMYQQNSKVENATTSHPLTPETDTVEPYSESSLESMLSFMDGIIKQALSLVQRLEVLEALSVTRTVQDRTVIQDDSDGSAPEENVPNFLSFI
ncbi:uncharacterized protein LOC125958179 [Anopheles darlingi]|uniref:uncharacterized protein LOC125958179 n=1 Tax=Anopheles darlingi TaxID=43151 RepID=UPI0021002A00|nr:uncharacterized protein LOC125958179 [Anopheles darlingi]